VTSSLAVFEVEIARLIKSRLKTRKKGQNVEIIDIFTYSSS